MKIREAIARDLSRPIEEIIKVTQADEQTVRGEIDEYVVTKRIREQYRGLLRAIAEAPSDPTEGVGVWVSGFFGSGKSAFAKNLGYVLANRTVCGAPAAELFKQRLDDVQGAALVDSITARIPTEVVMFDVQTERAAGAPAASISQYMYLALRRTLGYADDLNIADLEQSLEADGRLVEFVEHFEAHHRAVFEKDTRRFAEQLEREQWRWSYRRKLSSKFNEASAALHEVDPRTYPSAESWARSIKPIEVTPALLVDKTFALGARRAAGKALAYVVDEVGAYVAQSVERIEDLRAVIEQLGKESRNRVSRREAVGPVWVVVTSQEKLDEVVEALDSKRVEIARLRDRFRHEIDLSPADIREVATRRVLAKTTAGTKALDALYAKHEGQLNAALAIEGTTRKAEVRKQDFVEFYPYPPHFVDLSIDIMSGIRLQPGALRHLGGSNRTIIKQAYEMLASGRTSLKDEELGRLVTLDLVFELVEGNLSSEKQRDISEVAGRFGLASWEARVAKALALLEFVRDLPRSDRNLAAVLVDRVGVAAPLAQVREALTRLEAGEFVRRTPEGYKLQSAAEKSWTTERRAIDPKPRDRAEILRELIAEELSEPGVKVHSYKGLRSFRVGVTVDGTKIDEGHVPFAVVSAADSTEHAARVQEARDLTRLKEHENEVVWVWAAGADLEDAIREYYRSKEMIRKYQNPVSDGARSAEQEACLASEKVELGRHRGRVAEKLRLAMVSGTGVFQGISKDGPALGRSMQEISGGLLEVAVPKLYPKLEMGARPLSGNEAESVLTAAGLNALPQVLYTTGDGLGLIRKEGAKFVPNADAPVAKEVLGFVRARHQYGEKVTGKDLEIRFGGFGYGWESDLVRLVVAVLVRAGALEVTHQGKRYRDHQEPMVRQAITNKPAFRSASFAPRAAISRSTLADAAERFEKITGSEVDPEEGALAAAARALAGQEGEWLIGLRARLDAHRLPGRDELAALDETLRSLADAAPDECVRLLAEEGVSIGQALQAGRAIRAATASGGLEAIREARRALERLWPLLQVRSPAASVSEAAALLGSLLASVEIYGRVGEAKVAAQHIGGAYAAQYADAHSRRHDAFSTAMDEVRARGEWTELFPEGAERDETLRASMDALLAPLQSRRCGPVGELVAGEDDPVCPMCQAALAAIEADMVALPVHQGQAISALQAAATPSEVRVERVNVSHLWQRPIRTEEDMREALRHIEEALMKALAAGSHVVLD